MSQKSEKQPEKNVVVIGGGIVGLACAYSLQRQGLDVTILDPDEPQSRASTATAGIIGGSSVIPWASSKLWPSIPSHLMNPNGPLRMDFPLPGNLISFFAKSFQSGKKLPFMASVTGLAELGLNGYSCWMDLLNDCPECKDLFRQSGCFLVYPTEADKQNDKRSNQIRKNFGMELEEFSAKEIKALMPSLTRPVAGGAKVVNAAHVIDPLALQINLQKKIASNGGIFVASKAIEFETEGNLVKRVHTAGTAYDADFFVIASGFGSSVLATKLGSKVPLLAARGFSITFHGADVNLETPFLVLSEGIAVTPAKQGLRVSGLLEIGGTDTSDKLKFEKILTNQAKRLFGNFDFEKISSRTGARPLTPDSIPVIGQSPKFENTFFNFGHGHWGLTQASISGKIVTEMILNREHSNDILQFRATRF